MCSGIDISHPDFGGRAKYGKDIVYGGEEAFDELGHGTWVAGIVMSNTWGVAKKATAIAVKVTDRRGTATDDDIITGVNWVADQHKTGKKTILK